MKEFIQEAPVRPEGEADIESEISPEIRATLMAHIVDREPEQSGRRELVKRLGGATVGVAESYINRTDPPIYTESLTLSPGSIKVLIGPNGAGKSTLFDALMERGAYFDTRQGQGAISIGKPVHVREKLRVARLDQEELLGKINHLTAKEVLESAANYFKAEFPINWDDAEAYEANLKNQEAHVRIESLMSQISTLMHMDEFMATPVGNLSGGERTKLSLGMVLSSEPDVLLLDEPTNHLDLGSIAKLMALFDQYKEAGVATVNVSHVDWFLQDAGVDGVAEIVWDERGRRVVDSKAPYNKYMKNASRERVPIVSGEVEWLQKDYGYKQGQMLIESPLTVTIPDSPLKDVSVPVIQGGELTVLSGDNGSGKTKLMETMVYNRHEGLPRKQKGVQIAYLPQFWPEKIAGGTLGEFFEWVKEIGSPHSKGSAYHKDQPAVKLFIERARKLKFGGAGRIGESWLARPFKQFSGGEQRILWFLAASALRDIDMLALDEPTNHMDRDLQEKVMNAIRSFPGAVMLSTHDRNLLAALSKDGGGVGRTRIPGNIILTKREGRTTIAKSNEPPIKYMERVMEAARKEAKKVKI